MRIQHDLVTTRSCLISQKKNGYKNTKKPTKNNEKVHRNYPPDLNFILTLMTTTRARPPIDEEAKSVNKSGQRSDSDESPDYGTLFSEEVLSSKWYRSVKSSDQPPSPRETLSWQILKTNYILNKPPNLCWKTLETRFRK